MPRFYRADLPPRAVVKIQVYQYPRVASERFFHALAGRMASMKTLLIILWSLVALTLIIEVPLFLYVVNHPERPQGFWILAVPLAPLLVWLSHIFYWHKYRGNRSK